jgi:hypothetical protein
MPVGEGYEYSGLHAAIFIGGPSPAGIARLVRSLQRKERTDHRLRFATETVGGVHRGYAHVALEDDNDIAGLQDLLVELSERRELDGEIAVLGPPYVDPDGEIWPAKPRHCEVLAFVRIWVERGQAGIVLEALRGAVGDVFDGASIIYGAFDILLVLDGPDYSSVAGPALTAVPTVEGIVRTETLFADVRRYGEYAES